MPKDYNYTYQPAHSVVLWDLEMKRVSFSSNLKEVMKCWYGPELPDNYALTDKAEMVLSSEALLMGYPKDFKDIPIQPLVDNLKKRLSDIEDEIFAIQLVHGGNNG